MPWCDPCSRFHTTAEVATSGRCPTCGAPFGDDSNDDAKVQAPWHFWLLLAGVVGYLGWRLIQGLLWLIGV